MTAAEVAEQLARTGVRCTGCGATNIYPITVGQPCRWCGGKLEETTMDVETKANGNGGAAKAATALVKAEQHEQLSAYEPRNFDEALRIATVYASSRLLGEIASPEAALLIMAVGSELGISATTALRAVHVVKGKPVISSDLLVALCVRRTDICEYFICTESTEQSATYETKRAGVNQSVRNTFTIADAKRAQLGVDNPSSNWGKYPRAMLRHRCAAELARQVYPDIVLGLYVDAEEEEIRDQAPDTAITVQPVVERQEPEEPIEEAMARWRGLCAKAIETQDKAPAEKMRREIKARLQPGEPRYLEASTWYRDTIAKLRGKPPAERPPTQVVEGEIVTREPGSDDA